MARASRPWSCGTPQASVVLDRHQQERSVLPRGQQNAALGPISAAPMLVSTRAHGRDARATCRPLTPSLSPEYRGEGVNAVQCLVPRNGLFLCKQTPSFGSLRKRIVFFLGFTRPRSVSSTANRCYKRLVIAAASNSRGRDIGALLGSGAQRFGTWPVRQLRSI